MDDTQNDGFPDDEPNDDTSGNEREGSSFESSGSDPSKDVPEKARSYGLTWREVALLRLVAQGYSNQQISEALFLSPNTVRAHLYSIYSKLEVTTRAAAVRMASLFGLL